MVESMAHFPNLQLNRKGAGPVWPKYKAKLGGSEKNAHGSAKVSSLDPVLEESQSILALDKVLTKGDGELSAGLEFSEETDDLLEEGEYPEVVLTDKVDGENVPVGEPASDMETSLVGEDAIIPQGDGHKQRTIGKQVHKVKDGLIPGGGSHPVKKGMVALLKPPAQT
ncbi:PREDICTED: uncharacterized protein LOC109126521 [Camelina sativa]|uniref:Uncharacterized protein LOC109126521 n=1 Tax=Camelina sativa TaxID=90675 RepID=A0ABM1QG12_CAMSA|nr:PREDICTED: uncharacterized protein LOC109126521 [Camelina sativa]